MELRVKESIEDIGLDQAIHGEEAYDITYIRDHFAVTKQSKIKEAVEK